MPLPLGGPTAHRYLALLPPARAGSRPWLLTLGVALLLACGGDGPTAPPPPPPPPPPGASPVDVSGTVGGFFDPSTSYAGSVVTFEPAAAAAAGAQLDGLVDGGNGWRVEAVAPGDYLVTFSGASHLERRVRLRVQAGGDNLFGLIDLVESRGFRLAAYDEIYRQRSFSPPNMSNANSRWVAPPRFSFVEEHFEELGGDGAALRARIRDFIRDRLPEVSQGVMAGARIGAGSAVETPGNLCRSGGPVADLEVVVDAVESFTGPGGDRLGGATSVCPVGGNELARGILTFAPIAGGPVIAHEFGHLLGAQHLNSAAGSSIMRLPLTVDDFTPMDRRHLEYLYRRPPATRSPDDTSHLGAITGQVMAAARGPRLPAALSASPERPELGRTGLSASDDQSLDPPAEVPEAPHRPERP